MAFPAGLTQEVGRAGEEGNVAGLNGLSGIFPLALKAAWQAAARRNRWPVPQLLRGADCNAAQKVSACYVV